MAKTMKPYGVDITLTPETLTVLVNMFERKEDGGKEVIDTKTFNFNDITDEAILNQITCYGGSKILQDRTSDQSSNPERLDGMASVFDRLVAGQWAKEREAGGPTVSAEVEALAALKNVPVAAIQKALRGYDAEKRALILANPAVVKRAAEIRAQREEGEETSLDDLVAA